MRAILIGALGVAGIALLATLPAKASAAAPPARFAAISTPVALAPKLLAPAPRAAVRTPKAISYRSTMRSRRRWRHRGWAGNRRWHHRWSQRWQYRSADGVFWHRYRLPPVKIDERF